MRVVVRLVAGLILAVIFFLLLSPGDASEGLIWDKAAHAIAFILIPICLAIDLPFGRLTTLAAVSLALGGAVEIIQGWVGRDASWGDFIANGVGVLIAVLLLGALRSWKSRPHTPLNARRPD